MPALQHADGLAGFGTIYPEMLMNLIYRTTITACGALAVQALEQRMMILFGDEAPQDIAEYCYLHPVDTLSGAIVPGAMLHVGQYTSVVSAVGELAHANLAALGHVTLCFDSATSPQAPGCIHLCGELPCDIAAGEVVLFFNP